MHKVILYAQHKVYKVGNYYTYMDNSTILLIQKMNEHWQTNKVQGIDNTIKREKYYSALEYLEKKQILSIIGLRRTGKTTLLKQLISYLIENGINAKSIFYFSFDEITARKPEVIEEIIDFYANNIIKNDLRGEKVYIFFDEIQYIENWQAILKRYYDLNYNIKFIISGSATLNIAKKSKESLVGRLYEIKLTPLSFNEFLLFRGVNISNPSFEFDNMEKFYSENLWQKGKILSLLNEYLIRGGFPEVVNENTKITHEYIFNSTIEKIIYTDLPLNFPIKNPELLLKILQIIANESSRLFEVQKISNALNVSRNTIVLYLFYLEKAFLISFSYNYSKSMVKMQRTLKKAYINDCGILNTILRYDENVINYPEILGKIIETIAFIHCQSYKTFFYRDKQKREVDLIIEKETLIPIEIKYQTNIYSEDFKNIIYFMEKNNLKKGIIVTKDLLTLKKEKNKEIILIPLWIFLLAI